MAPRITKQEIRMFILMGILLAIFFVWYLITG